MKLKTLILPALAAITLSLAGAQAIAQTPMDDPLDDRSVRRLEKMEKVVRELRAIVFQGRDTGKPVVVQPAETDGQIQTLTERVADLEQTLTRMNGQNETLTRELQLARQSLAESQARNRDLDARLSAVERKTTDLEAVAQGPALPPAPVVDPVVQATPEQSAAESFRQARQLLVDGDYGAAENAFRTYVDSYGDTPKGPEARYWLGETLYKRGAYNDAATAYIGAIRGWPASAWAPSATLKLARSLVAMGKGADACRTLDELAKRYPKAAPPVPAQAATTRVQAKCAA